MTDTTAYLRQIDHGLSGQLQGKLCRGHCHNIAGDVECYMSKQLQKNNLLAPFLENFLEKSWFPAKIMYEQLSFM